MGGGCIHTIQHYKASKPLQGSRTTNVEKNKRFNLMLSTAHDYLFDNPCLFEPANEMACMMQHQLFILGRFFNFKLDRDVDNN